MAEDVVAPALGKQEVLAGAALYSNASEARCGWHSNVLTVLMLTLTFRWLLPIMSESVAPYAFNVLRPAIKLWNPPASGRHTIR